MSHRIMRPLTKPPPSTSAFSLAQREWQKRRTRMADSAVGRMGEDHIEQGRRIAESLRAELTGYYAHALDFGCGWGRLVPLLTQHCGHLWAVDMFQDWIERAAAPPTVTGMLLTEPKLALEDASMNLIVDIMTFQSIKSVKMKEQYASELRRVAAPGATFISLSKASDDWARETLSSSLALDSNATFSTADTTIDTAGDTYYFLVGKKGGE